MRFLRTSVSAANGLTAEYYAHQTNQAPATGIAVSTSFEGGSTARL